MMSILPTLSCSVLLSVILGVSIFPATDAYTTCFVPAVDLFRRRQIRDYCSSAKKTTPLFPPRLFIRLLASSTNNKDGNDITPSQFKQASEGEASSGGSSDNDNDPDSKSTSLLRLAELSLEDYAWRSSLFQEQQADRKVEESLARMMGDEASYVRPMDAGESKIGPLGLWEQESVDWLTKVIEEEAMRAKEIVRLGGMMVRPIDLDEADLGPLGYMEKQLVEWINMVKMAEKERSKTMTMRPKDLDESKRGPLGKAELRAVRAIREVLDGERLRAEQSKQQEGIVRPIDVPGPLGDFEMAVLEVVKAEQQRKQDREEAGSLLVRPMDSSRKGPLGQLEEQAMVAVEKLTQEEKERLRNIQRFLDEKRPMDQDKSSILGVVETVMVGIFRAPVLVFQILSRVKELLDSEKIAEEDADVLKRWRKEIEETKNDQQPDEK